MSAIDFDELAQKVRKWGRRGSDDQRGTLNHIGPETLQRAVTNVRSGKLFNLGLNFDRNGPQLGPYRFNPKLYVTELGRPLNPERPDGGCFSDDVVHMPPQAATQWDALGHVHYDGVLYNNCNACDVLSTRGAARNAIQHLAAPGIMSRGMLIDSAFNGLQPGVGTDCAGWLYDHSVAAIAADNVAVEIIPPGMAKSEMPLPFHMLALRDMGCPLGEMFHLEALAQDCAVDGQYTLLLSAPPLAITGAFGSPVNPLALK